MDGQTRTTDILTILMQMFQIVNKTDCQTPKNFHIFIIYEKLAGRAFCPPPSLRRVKFPVLPRINFFMKRKIGTPASKPLLDNLDKLDA